MHIGFLYWDIQVNLIYNLESRHEWVLIGTGKRVLHRVVNRTLYRTRLRFKIELESCSKSSLTLGPTAISAKLIFPRIQKYTYDVAMFQLGMMLQTAALLETALFTNYLGFQPVG